MSLSPEEQKKKDEEERAEQQKNLFSMFDPRTWFSSFGFGDIFTMLFVAIIGYVALGNEKVQGFVGQLFDGDKKDSGKEKIAGWMDGIKGFFLGLLPKSMKENIDVTERIENATPEEVETYLKDVPENLRGVMKTNFKAISKIALAQNGGKANAANAESLFTSDQTIFTLLTQQPTLVVQMMKALKADNVGGAISEEGKQKTASIMQSIKAIASDARLDVLLNDKNRKNTIGILMELMPNSGLTADAVDTMIRSNMAKNKGKISADMRAYLISIIDDKVKTYTTPEGASLTAAKPPPVPLPAEAVIMGAGVMLGKKNTDALDKLKSTLGEDNFSQLFETLQFGSESQKNILCLKSQNVNAVLAFAKMVDVNAIPEENRAKLSKPLAELKKIGTKPEAYRKVISAIADQNIDPGVFSAIFTEDAVGAKIKEINASTVMTALFDANKLGVRRTMEAAGYNNVATLMQSSITDTPALKSIVTGENLKAFCGYANSLEKLPSAPGQTLNMRNAAIVSNALMEFAINGNGEPMKQHATMIAQFFNRPGFEAAFHKLIQGLKIPDKAALLGEIHKNWGKLNQTPQNDTAGFVEILASAEALRQLPEVMKEAKNNPNKSDALWGWDFARGKFGGTDGEIYENRNALKPISATKTDTAKRPAKVSITL